MTDPINTTQPVSTPAISVDDAKLLQQQLKDALAEIREAKKLDEYYENNDSADIEILEAKLKGSLTAVNIFLTTGKWPEEAGGGSSTTNNNDIAQLIGDLKDGWNGNTAIPPNSTRPSYLPADVEYAGTIAIKDNGDPTQEIKLILKLDPTATKLEAYNHGSDIIYVETYIDGAGNTKKKAWVGKNHATNVRANIMIDAHTLDHKVTIDLSKTYRVSNGTGNVPYGTVGGFVVMGTDHNDTLLGSQGNDTIMGLKGDDAIGGMAGDDTVYGDDEEQWALARGVTDLADGNDIIDGGAGDDTLWGSTVGRDDGDYNTGYKQNAAIGDQDTLNAVNPDLTATNVTPATGDWLVTQGPDATNGWKTTDVSPGVVRLTEDYDPTTNGAPNVLSLKMPDGYDMAFAEKTADGTLKITMVGRNADGTPKTFVILIQGALSPRTASLKSPFTLKFSGNSSDNIIDFNNGGKLDFGNNLLVLSGGKKDDMILAPLNELTKDNLTLDGLLIPQNTPSTRELQEIKDKVVPYQDDPDQTGENGDGIKAEIPAGKNEIEISRTDSGTDEKPLLIDPQDYDKAYVLTDPAHPEDLLVKLVKKPLVEGGAPQILTIRIKDYKNFQQDRTQNPGDLSWLKFGNLTHTAVGTAPAVTTPFTDVVPLIYSDLDHDGKFDTGTYIVGNDGKDVAFHTAQDKVAADVEDEVLGTYKDPALQPKPKDDENA